ISCPGAFRRSGGGSGLTLMPSPTTLQKSTVLPRQRSRSAMNPLYTVRDTSAVFTPGLLFYKELIRRNIARAVEMAGTRDRLRPHAKTHKTREIVRMELEAGITKHKCAPLAEAEMIAASGAPDVLIAYPIVGPNRNRLVQLIKAYPQCR